MHHHEITICVETTLNKCPKREWNGDLLFELYGTDILLWIGLHIDEFSKTVDVYSVSWNHWSETCTKVIDFDTQFSNPDCSAVDDDIRTNKEGIAESMSFKISSRLFSVYWAYLEIKVYSGFVFLYTLYTIYIQIDDRYAKYIRGFKMQPMKYLDGFTFCLTEYIEVKNLKV